MKTTSYQQKASSQQILLDEYIVLKPQRAVQRMLQQNDLETCIGLYNLLQQNVKSNTNQLRSVLYSKHQNLHECSEMIQKIKQFADKVNKIQEEIDACLNTPLIDDDLKLDTSQILNPIAKIEQLINEKQFTSALRSCKQTINEFDSRKSFENDEDSYYITFLKVEIIQKLQKYLQETALCDQSINEAIAAVRQFMDLSTFEEISGYVQQSMVPVSQATISPLMVEGKEMSILDQSTSILQLLHEMCTQQLKNYPLQQNQIIEVIFKFKLLSIKQSSQVASQERSEQKVQHLYSKIFNYFSDLLQILNQVANRKINDNLLGQFDSDIYGSKNKLNQIFNSNIKKAVSHISELFITKKKKDPQSNIGYDRSKSEDDSGLQALSFQSELYERLLSSEEFLSILCSLSQRFKGSFVGGDSNGDQQLELVSLIKNLWRDFYCQMLEIVTEKINPQKWFKIPDSPWLPQQLVIYSVTQHTKNAKKQLQMYEKQLGVFHDNLSELLVKSKSVEEKQSILGYFMGLKDQVLAGCQRMIGMKKVSIEQLNNLKRSQTTKKMAQKQVRELIMLVLFVKSYNLSWARQLQRESSFLKTLTEIYPQRIPVQKFHIYLFERDSATNQESQIFYEAINSYLQLVIDKGRRSEGEQIDRWQQELDLLFGGYSSLCKDRLSLQKQLKHLLLALIKTKLCVLQAS